MRLFPPKLKIDDHEGFSEQNKLNRKPFADGLTWLLTEAEAPMVMALDSPWGSGKSTFVKMWAGEMRKQGLAVIIFDAFVYDRTGDAFASLADEVVKLAKVAKVDDTRPYKHWKNR